VSTVWVLERLLKDTDDLKAYLQLPDEVFAQNVDVSNMIAEDELMGDRGIIMMDTGDPLCTAASLFSMEDYVVIAMTEQDLFRSLLDKLAPSMYAIAESVASSFPGHLWRICGAEYATEPYLPPYLFHEYVTKYTGPIVESITKYGGFARLHCHGRIKNALPYMMEMGIDGIDPIEPFPQGNVQLADVRREYGKDLVLFGNLEASDVENMDPAEFEKVVAKSIEDGTSGEGRGFVLMPSSSPYGRTISAKTMANYETMVRLVGA
jgi:uroporphyrinogen-III decarboxylase